jgi:hypothetical protein
VQAADPALRGATMGLHSICGYGADSSVRSHLGLRSILLGRNPVQDWDSVLARNVSFGSMGACRFHPIHGSAFPMKMAAPRR